MNIRVAVLSLFLVLAMMAWSCSSATSPSNQTNIPVTDQESSAPEVDEDDSVPPISDENPVQQNENPDDEYLLYNGKYIVKMNIEHFERSAPIEQWGNKTLYELTDDTYINPRSCLSTSEGRKLGLPSRVLISPLATQPLNLNRHYGSSALDVQPWTISVHNLTPEAKFDLAPKELKECISPDGTILDYEKIRGAVIQILIKDFGDVTGIRCRNYISPVTGATGRRCKYETYVDKLTQYYPWMPEKMVEMVVFESDCIRKSLGIGCKDGDFEASQWDCSKLCEGYELWTTE